MGLAADAFDEFFTSLHNVKPFPWQKELAGRVIEERRWPGAIDLPTGSGKTACVDIAVYSAAACADLPKRIFFVVDRRVVVNEVYGRMRRIARVLADAKEGVLAEVAARLRGLSGEPDADPVQVFEMRGGIYRDESWVRNPQQVMLVASTVDQVGSRLLFRGYGLRDEILPIHAGLVGTDSLIILDEAHCSKAFAQTLASVKEYRSKGWMRKDLARPFEFVEMTATPTREDEGRLELSAEDRTLLQPRLCASKRVELVECKGKAEDRAALAEALVKQAKSLAASNTSLKRIAILTNRVETARRVFERLEGSTADLVIGRMRPVDRDLVSSRLAGLKSGEKRGAADQLRFVVATQCLEVGADLDFDAMVSECAAIDALIQRFGRLNRLGELSNSPGRIVALSGQVDGKRPDAVYGEALKRTWDWLSTLAKSDEGSVNFGITSKQGSAETVGEQLKALPPEQRSEMLTTTPDAPVLFPAHLDALAQTSPRPAEEPAVELFLHGPQRVATDVQVVWRMDLDPAAPQDWAAIVEMSPPVSAEAMPVTLPVFRRWAKGEEGSASQADVEGVVIEEAGDKGKGQAPRPVLVWRGSESALWPEETIRPGDTVVVPVEYGGWEDLGHRPAGAPEDVADAAYYTARRKVRLRIHPRAVRNEVWPQAVAKDRLVELATGDYDWEALRLAAEQYVLDSGASLPGWLDAGLQAFTAWNQSQFAVDVYPDGRGLVIQSRRRVSGPGTTVEEDGGSDELSKGPIVTLDQHLKHVETAVETTAAGLAEEIMDAMRAAARWHDAGKADHRFQTLLNGGDRLAAQLAPGFLAKGHLAGSRGGRSAWDASDLPDGFRHELLSLLLMRCVGEDRELALHLVASHHGRCRPFAPVVLDEKCSSLVFNGAEVSAEDRTNSAAHRLDSGVSDRFWSLNRTFGWWGLAYLEAVFRLADWKASAEEAKGLTA